MEPWNSPDYEGMSPSQDNIAHQESIKRENESLEDFEHITKEEPTAKDLTAQFLQFETGVKNTSDDFVYKPEKEFHFDVTEESEKYSSDDETDQMANESPQLSRSSIPSKLTDQQDSVNELLFTEQSDNQKENDDVALNDHFSIHTGKSLLNILNEKKLVGVVSSGEVSVGSDDLSFIPKKGESSPVLYSEIEKDILKKLPSECRSSETTDSTFNSQPLSKFTSESGVNREQEPEKLLGDGLHVKEAFEADISDNDDDFVPEPIPKDYPEMIASERKEFITPIQLGTWLHPDALHPQVESLIYWRDPKKSGIVFGAVMVILLSLTSFSLISVVAYTALIALVSALAFRIYKSVMQAVQKTSEGHPFKKYLVAVLDHPVITTVFNTIEEYLDIDLTVNPEKAREISDMAVKYVNGALTEFRRLFLIEDAIDSVKFGVLLWCLTYVGAWFNGLSLLIIAFVGLFTLPKVYENNKTQIDANIDIVRTKINEVTEKITAVIPLGKKTEEVKDKAE